MFETIVWATDGSPFADRALPFVLALAGCHDSRIVVVHANELLAGRMGGAPMLADEPDLVAKIKEQVKELHDQGFDAELKIETSAQHTVAELVAIAAREVKADVIVVGTHGRGGLRAAMLGSVARGLLHAACCPVLAIPPAVPETAAAPERETVTTG